MKNYLLRLLIAVVGLAVVQGFVYQALCATPESQKEAKSEQEKDWENTDRYNIDAIKAFLVRYPKGDMNDVIRERLVLMQKMKAIQDGNQSSLVVPFSMLAPWVEKWAEENNEKTVALYSAVKNGERTMYGVGTTLGEPGAVTIMRRGFMCAVLGQGTIIAFQTNGLEFTWPEGITFVSDVNSTLFFGVLPKKGGLVFLKGKGKFIKLDGKEVVLNDTALRKNEAIIGVLNSPVRAAGQEVVSVYHSERGRFSVSLPATWEKQEQDMGHGVWGLLAQSPEENSSDPFLENVNIVIVPADTADLSEANTRGIEVLKRNMAQFTLLDHAVGKIGQHSASWFVHKFSYEGHTLMVIKYTLINGSEMYLATCTALPETFERFRPVFESIAASIAFDEPSTPRVSPTASQSHPDSFNLANTLGVLIGAIVGLYALIRVFTKKK